ncbi:MAG: diaminopimelate decarboxylase [Flavobacteriales bacterium]
MFDNRHFELFQPHETPFYYYDMELLQRTLDLVKTESGHYGYHVHYALKANTNPRILQAVQQTGLGADCVSGNEVLAALDAGFAPKNIVLAGVGKTDKEIKIAIEEGIFSLNVESLPELKVIGEIATSLGKKATIALRINPNVDANTHKYITTGLSENKFGLGVHEIFNAIEIIKSNALLDFAGLHFHIGSQITDLTSFRSLCVKVNEINSMLQKKNIRPTHINLGGGLGVDYHSPDENPVADFVNYFKLFDDFLELLPGQQVHFEIGRAIVAQCGTLVTRVLFVKAGIKTHFLIVDAGMNDLIRPALYQAYHKIQNLTRSNEIHDKEFYDVVGPVCESSDCFGKRISLPRSQRGDLLLIRTAGAYAEAMASTYNLRPVAQSVFGEKVVV